jgi:hypothetical protein
VTAGIPPLAGSVPALDFTVIGAAPVTPAAAPVLRFQVLVTSTTGLAVRSVLLETQIQIAARRRSYDAAEEPRLFELFGEPERWSATLRTLPWTRLTTIVPAFAEETVVALDVPCTYDFEVAASRYLDAVRDGHVPLELLFGGTVFFTAQDGRLQTARIPWDCEAAYRLPAHVWHDTMDRCFPGTAWVRMRRETFDRLQAHKARHALTSVDAALDALLGEA